MSDALETLRRELATTSRDHEHLVRPGNRDAARNVRLDMATAAKAPWAQFLQAFVAGEKENDTSPRTRESKLDEDDKAYPRELDGRATSRSLNPFNALISEVTS